uniref:Solute carrier family 35 member B4 n=1 Tax=Myotis myotis TaxID=51298 RepID=A0A7J7V528_MYOMY|nr:solute carrier family 35 member B4 [Myotis myotis]
MSAKQVTYQSSLSENEGFQAFTWWLLGIGALTFALLMSARMGIFQETLYKQFGKHSKEALFYNNYIKFRLLVWQCPSCGSTSSRMSSLKKGWKDWGPDQLENPFTVCHWLDTLFVFIGTLMYKEVWNNLGITRSQPQKEDKKN